jgi:hypothetical protein
MDAAFKTRPPRGAVIVVIVGLVATVAAALLSTEEAGGSAAELTWEAKAPLADSKVAPVPGGGSMQLREGGIRSSETNVSGYKIYRVAAVLRIAAGSAVGKARVRCSTRVPGSAIATHTPGSRADYPRSSSGEDLRKQEVPERALVEFSSHGTELGTLELGDAFDEFVNEPGVVVSWSPFHPDIQEWQWGLPGGQPKKPLELGFASFWRTTATPAAKVKCSVQTGAGTATVRTAGTLAES